MTENQKVWSLLKNSNLSPPVRNASYKIWHMLDGLSKIFVLSAIDKSLPQDKLFALATALGNECSNLDLPQRENSL